MPALLYVSPREIKSSSSTYNNKTYEYTHGYGTIITSASRTSDSGALSYINSSFENSENSVKISEPRIYFGLQTNDLIAINQNEDKEYDYPLTSTSNNYNTYDGKAGIKLGFFDRLILGIKEKNIKLAFSKDINSETNIIIKRNILDRKQR